MFPFGIDVSCFSWKLPQIGFDVFHPFTDGSELYFQVSEFSHYVHFFVCLFVFREKLSCFFIVKWHSLFDVLWYTRLDMTKLGIQTLKKNVLFISWTSQNESKHSPAIGQKRCRKDVQTSHDWIVCVQLVPQNVHSLILLGKVFFCCFMLCWAFWGHVNKSWFCFCRYQSYSPGNHL